LKNKEGEEKMGSSAVRVAWKVYLAYGIYLVALGLMALIAPQGLYVGQFEAFTRSPFAEFAAQNGAVAAFIGFAFRLFGCMALLVGIFKVFLALYPYRRAQAWSWWAALVVGVVAYSFLFPYSFLIGDRMTLTVTAVSAIILLVALVLPVKVMLSQKKSP
jgi:uncharacterized membrane protein HdeD (DUF308 family)